MSVAEKDNLGWVYASATLVRQDGNPVCIKEASQQGWVFSGLLKEMFIVGSMSSVLARKELLLTCGELDSNVIEDWDYWLRLARLSPVGYVKKPIVNIRSFSTRNRSSNYADKIRRVERQIYKYKSEYEYHSLWSYAKKHIVFIKIRQSYINRRYKELIVNTLLFMVLPGRYTSFAKLKRWRERFKVYK